jgi:hypothetical protein
MKRYPHRTPDETRCTTCGAGLVPSEMNAGRTRCVLCSARLAARRARYKAKLAERRKDLERAA